MPILGNFYLNVFLTKLSLLTFPFCNGEQKRAKQTFLVLDLTLGERTENTSDRFLSKMKLQNVLVWRGET